MNIAFNRFTDDLCDAFLTHRAGYEEIYVIALNNEWGFDLKETEVKKVVQRFLKDRKTKYYPAKGAGPDILLKDGGAIETKGKKFAFKRALEQFIRYSLTQPKFGVAMSADTLDIKTIFALYIIEKSLEALSKPPIAIYLIVKVEDDKYRVRIYASTEELFNYVSSKFVEKLYIPIDVELEESIQRNVNTMWNINEELRRILEAEAKSIMGYEVIL